MSGRCRRRPWGCNARAGKSRVFHVTISACRLCRMDPDGPGLHIVRRLSVSLPIQRLYADEQEIVAAFAELGHFVEAND